MNVGLAERGLRSATELAQGKPHGTRIRYMAGCRCHSCRAANSAYERERQQARKAGDWNGIVSAARARLHIMKLRRKGVGRRAIGAASDVSDTVLSDIITKRKTRIRARTERRILAVTTKMASDHALVGAAASWRLIDRLLEEGYTKADLTKQLGYANLALQLNERQITVRNAARIERLYRRLTA